MLPRATAWETGRNGGYGAADTTKESSMTTAKINDLDMDTRGALNALDWVALVLLIIGGLNWGLVGLFSFDLVAAIFGSLTVISRLVYVLVGLAAVYAIYMAVRFGSARR